MNEKSEFAFNHSCLLQLFDYQPRKVLGKDPLGPVDKASRLPPGAE